MYVYNIDLDPYRYKIFEDDDGDDIDIIGGGKKTGGCGWKGGGRERAFTSSFLSLDHDVCVYICMYWMCKASSVMRIYLETARTRNVAALK